MPIVGGTVILQRTLCQNVLLCRVSSRVVNYTHIGGGPGKYLWGGAGAGLREGRIRGSLGLPLVWIGPKQGRGSALSLDGRKAAQDWSVITRDTVNGYVQLSLCMLLFNFFVCFIHFWFYANMLFHVIQYV